MSIPKCIMFDEPSLGIAPNLVEQILAVVQQIAHEGITVILVEQEVKKALKISGKVKLVYPEKKHLSFLDYLIENVATKVKQALVEEYPTMPFGRLYFR